MKKYVQEAIDFLLIIFSLCVFLFILNRLVNSPASWSVSEISHALIALTIIAAFLTLAFNHRTLAFNQSSFASNQLRLASEDYLNNAIDLLSKSYELVSGVDNRNYPSKDRLNWLSAARLIKSSENISNLITEKSHILIWEEYKEYWRAKFSDIIRSENFYAEYPIDMIVLPQEGRQPVSEKSLAIVYRFSRWNPDRPNPIENELEFTDEEINQMSVEDTPLYKILSEMRRIKSEDRVAHELQHRQGMEETISTLDQVK